MKSVLRATLTFAVLLVLLAFAGTIGATSSQGVVVAQGSEPPAPALVSGATAVQVERSELVFLNDGQNQGWVIVPQQSLLNAGAQVCSTVRGAEFLDKLGCGLFESVVSDYTGQTYLCYENFGLPTFEQLASAPFLLTPEQEADVFARPANTVFLPSLAERAPGTGAFFQNGSEVYYLLWIAGDCTPRIVDGLGGYWEVPVTPFYDGYIPWGVGYLIELPADWQSAWAVEPAEAAEWRTCGASTFMNSAFHSFATSSLSPFL